MGFSDFSGQRASDVQAERLTEQRSIITPNGPITGEEGDWEVREPGGNVRHLTDDEFKAEYGDSSAGDSDADKAVSDERETDSDDSDDEESSVEDDGSGTLDESKDETQTAQPEEHSSGDKSESGEETPSRSRPPSVRRR